MKKSNGISHLFNGLVQKFIEYKQHKDLLKLAGYAVEHDDGSSVRKSLNELKEMSNYSDGDFNELMIKAIEGDHVNAFSALFEDIDNPNYVLNTMSDVGVDVGYYITEEKSLLFKAIEARSPGIALIIANDPRTDITKSGKEEGIVGLRDYKKVYEMPLDAVRKQGAEMDQVASVLAKRSAEIKVQEARNLMKESRIRRGPEV